MKRIGFLLTVFVLSAISTIQAASVSPDQAKQIAAQFISAKQQQYREQGKPVRRATPVAQEMEAKVLFEARHNDSNPYLYAVRYPQQEGFVLISGDDRFAPVLGYSETGSIEVSSMPENLRAWLQGYVDEMHFLDSIGYQYTPSQHAPAAKEEKTEESTFFASSRTFSLSLSHADSVQNLMTQTRHLALFDFPILIQGESGTQRRTLARAIHNFSRRHHYPFSVLHSPGNDLTEASLLRLLAETSRIALI